MGRFPELRGLGASLPLGLVSAGVWLVWAWLDGGHSPTAVAALGVVLVGLLVLGLVYLGPGLLAESRARAVMAAALLAFALWNALSIAWADFPGDAWAGANKTAAYVAGFLVLALWPLPVRALELLLGAFSLGTAVTAAVVLVRAAASADPESYFFDDRLIAPTGYVNANVALWMCALWPAVHLGSRRDLPPWARALFLAAAAVLLDVAVLGQSRAWLAVLPVAALLFVALQRQRLRALLGLAIVAASSAVALRPLLDVYDRAAAGGAVAGPLDRAVPFVAGAALAAAVMGIAWALLDARVVLAPRVTRVVGAAIAALALAGAVAGVVGAAAAVDSPRDWVAAKWDEFTCPYCPSTGGGSRLTGTLSNDRYRTWTIAWNAFTAHPVAGIGSDNFAAEYLVHRTDPYFHPRYPHSLPLRLLSQLGLVGTALLALGLGLALALALAARRRLDPARAGAVGAAVMVFAYWALHGAVDWFWELPALAAPALGLLAAAGATSADPAPAPTLPRRTTLVVTTLAVVLAGATAVSLGLRWLSESFQEAAKRTWVAHPERAYSRLDAAARLDPLSAEPLLLEGSIALKRGDRARARDALDEARAREPRNWYVRFQLGVLAASGGDFATASRHLLAARRLNPRDPIAALAERLVRRRIRLDPQAIDALYLDEAERLFDRPVFERHRFERYRVGTGE
ncbi:MAG TPA: O-antigen ligase family protein [Gaiellaceae bacterium]|nr:O-antigen ligase family protein [Gaiellaceae bacterium]